MRRNRSTKIVATVGPASNSPERLKALFLAGVDVFRLNFSHGTQADHGAVIDRIRALEAETAAPSASSPTFRGRSCGLAASRKTPSPSPPARCCASISEVERLAMPTGCRSRIPTSSKP